MKTNIDKFVEKYITARDKWIIKGFREALLKDTEEIKREFPNDGDSGYFEGFYEFEGKVRKLLKREVKKNGYKRRI